MLRVVTIDSTLHGLADPIRRATLQRLGQGPATAGQLAHLFDVSRPAVSRHLGVLRSSGLVTAESSGRNVWYQASGEPLSELEQWLHDLAKRITDAPRRNS